MAAASLPHFLFLTNSGEFAGLAENYLLYLIGLSVKRLRINTWALRICSF